MATLEMGLFILVFGILGAFGVRAIVERLAAITRPPTPQRPPPPAVQIVLVDRRSGLVIDGQAARILGHD